MARRLLVIGDGGTPTGYARVIGSILRNLPAAVYDVHHLAVNYSGDPHEENWKLYPAARGGDTFGIGRLKDLYDRLVPDVVFCVADLWIQKQYLEILETCSPTPRIVVYAPVDAGPVDPD